MAVGEDDIIGRDLKGVDDLKKKLNWIPIKDSEEKSDMNKGIVSVFQKFYIKKILKKFGLWNRCAGSSVCCITWKLWN